MLSVCAEGVRVRDDVDADRAARALTKSTGGAGRSRGPPGGQGVSVAPHLSISVNGVETIHEFIGDGSDTVFLHVSRPVERFNSFLFPFEDLETMEA